MSLLIISLKPSLLSRTSVIAEYSENSFQREWRGTATKKYAVVIANQCIACNETLSYNMTRSNADGSLASLSKLPIKERGLQ